MKLCWENLDKLCLTRGGCLRVRGGGNEYVYKDRCETCGKPFLAIKTRPNGKVHIDSFCCLSCAYQREVTVETRNKLSKIHLGKTRTIEHRNKISKANTGDKHPMFGKKHTVESRNKMSKSRKGRKLSDKHVRSIVLSRTGKKHTAETIQKMRKANIGKHVGERNTFFGKRHTPESIQKMRKAKAGSKSAGWKGGVIEKNIALYDTYAHQLAVFEKVRHYMVLVDNVVYKSLQVLCYEHRCGKWFMPTRAQVKERLRAFNGTGGSNFYCSFECKMNCSSYKQLKHPKGHKDILRTYSESELKIWAREVLRKANFTCVVCGEQASIGHHLKSKIEYPEFALDSAMGVATCKMCHHQVFHSGKDNPSHYIDKCREPDIKNKKS